MILFFACEKAVNCDFSSPFVFSCKLIIVMFGIILNFDRFTSCTRLFVSVYLFVCFCFLSVLFLPPKLVSSSSGFAYSKTQKGKDEPSLKPRRVSKSVVCYKLECVYFVPHARANFAQCLQTVF